VRRIREKEKRGGGREGREEEKEEREGGRF
jgi:hypothetical protein